MDAVVSCDDLVKMIAENQLHALLDVRERGEFNDGQIPHATSLPRSQIEFRIAALVPDRTVPIVVYDEGGGRAPLAAATLRGLGYEAVSLLDRGLSAWREQGRRVVRGVNMPSKAFGEKVHDERRVADLTAEELKALQGGSRELLILDVRTAEEYARFCIPGAVNVPGGDLILWAGELKRRKDAVVVINCAGRTRSIIGAAALQRLGLTRARALRNGTMGWVLAGLELERNPERQQPQPPPGSREEAVMLARRLAAEEAIPSTSVQELARLTEMNGGMHYLIDVRSEAEYESGHVPRSLNVPGGQAVQRADDFIAVRNAPIVFISSKSARAVMAAYWYRQMGFVNASFLEGGVSAWSENDRPLMVGAPADEPLGLAAAKAPARFIAAADLGRVRGDSAVLILDVGTSADYESAHVPGARWISRGSIESLLPERFADLGQPIVVSCPDGRQSVFAGQTLVEMGYAEVKVLEGGVRGWLAAGRTAETGLSSCLASPNDVVLSPSIRGTPEDMRRYLEWELSLNR